MKNTWTNKNDEKQKHCVVTKAGMVYRVIARDVAIKLFSMKSDEAPVIYCVWDIYGASAISSKAELYNDNAVFGILVGSLSDMVDEYNNINKDML